MNAGISIQPQLKSALLMLLGCVLILPPPAPAQSTSSRRPPAKTAQEPTNSAEAELDQRITAAQDARTSGDASAIALANQRLIALALRELGQLRLLQGAYPQAVELYRRSLDFEGLPDTRVDLGIAELLANHPDQAIAESIQALAVDPNNLRAFNLRGQAWMKKGEYAKAAEAFDQATRLNPDVGDLLFSRDLPVANQRHERQGSRLRCVPAHDPTRGRQRVLTRTVWQGLPGRR